MANGLCADGVKVPHEKRLRPISRYTVSIYVYIIQKQKHIVVLRYFLSGIYTIAFGHSKMNTTQWRQFKKKIYIYINIMKYNPKLRCILNIKLLVRHHRCRIISRLLEHTRYTMVKDVPRFFLTKTPSIVSVFQQFKNVYCASIVFGIRHYIVNICLKIVKRNKTSWTKSKCAMFYRHYIQS